MTDMPSHRRFLGFMEAQRQLDREGTLMTHRVGLARINAVEARRQQNEVRRPLPLPGALK